MFIVTTSVVAILWGCSGKPPQTDTPEMGKTLATVNGVDITEADVGLRLQSVHGKVPGSEEIRKESALEEIIREELLYQEGMKLGLDRDPIYRNKIARLERQLADVKRAEMARRVYNTEIASKIEVTTEDARRYYDAHAEEISTELHLGVITFSNGGDANRELNAIREGTPFEEVARRIMGGESVRGREPWDLGFVSWGTLPLEVSDSVYRLKTGEVSNVLGSRRGRFQVFMVLGSRKKPDVSFQNASGVILNRLRDQKMREAYDQYVARLRREGTVLMHEGNNPAH